MSARDLLIEIGTEELPPKSLPALSQAFGDGVVAGLDALGVRHGKASLYATPRRLAVLVKRVAERQPDQELKRRGPPLSAAFGADGQPTRAATAFAESCGTSVAALGRITEPKGEFLHYVGVKPGAATATLIEGVVGAALEKLPIAKRMRWGSGSAEFVRPVHWVVMLFGHDVVPARVLDVAAGATTRGHRFMAPRPITLRSPASYATRLAKAGYVIADFAARRARIAEGVAALAAAAGARAVASDALLDEVTALVEWPVPIAGRFEERYLELPPEVLIATLQDHQRYFPLRAPDGRLLAGFVTVANLESRDPAVVRAGNERVVRPRLADAAFFWTQDRREPLAARAAALARVTFQAQLGSYAQKSARVEALAVALAAPTGADAAACARAARLAKCDLLTGLVGEFPELQGTMGSYYARHDGEPAEVAAAMAEQYLPRFAGDALPATAVGTALALADKLDTIVGIFAIGQKPSGTKDPFGLRRLALGVLRILIEKRIDIDLVALIEQALARVEADIAAGRPPSVQVFQAAPLIPEIRKAATQAVYDYIFERLRAHYLEDGAGITTEMFDAVLDRRPRSPLDFDARLRALGQFLALPDAQALTGANKRIANILRKAERAPSHALEASLLEAPEERALAAALEGVTPTVTERLAARDYSGALVALARLRPAVDAFFDKVLVMAEAPAVRANRLQLLASVQRLFLEVADLSRLPG